MPEVLKLEYHAATEMLLVELDATHDYVDADGKPQKGVLAGAPKPTHAWSLAELEAKHPKMSADIRDLIAQLHDVTREEIESGTMTQDQLRAEQNRIAKDRLRFAQEAEKHRQLQADSAELDKHLEAKRAAHAAELERLDAEMAKKLAEHASVTAPKP